MMRQSRKMLMVRAASLAAIAACVLLVGMWANWRIDHILQQRELDGLVQQSLTADMEGLTPVLGKLDAVKERSKPVLSAIADNPNTEEDERLRALLFLAPHSTDFLKSLLNRLTDADVKTVAAVRKRFATTPEMIEDVVWELMRMPHSSHAALRYVAATTRSTQKSQAIVDSNSAELCEALLDEQVGQFDRFCEMMAVHSLALVPQLIERFHDTLSNEAQRDAAARALARFANAKQLCGLVEDASPAQHQILCSSMQAGGAVMPILVERLENQLANNVHTKRTGSMLIALLRMAPDHALIERCLSETSDPTARTHFITSCFEFGVPLDKLVQATKAAKTSLSRQALILALEPYRVNRRYPNMAPRVCGELTSLVSSCPEHKVRSAAQWVLSRWQVEAPPADPAFCTMPELVAGEVPKRDWWQNGQQQVMCILKLPIRDADPQSLTEVGNQSGTPKSYFTFAISATEVTRGQLDRFDSNFEYQLKAMQTDECPANNVPFLVAMQYCRWLSEKEEIPESEMCYPAKNEITIEHASLDDSHLNKRGYRLPTEAEWEWACGGMSKTQWPHGEDSEKLELFAWMAANSSQRLHPVGSLIPNAFGLSDGLGNVSEWCHPAPGAEGGVALRGGNYTVPPQRLLTNIQNYTASRGFSFTGFRVVKTMSGNSPPPSH